MTATELLAAAVTALGGATRPGQVAMTEAVATALESERHLAVQAGTGTGKSLAYLVPAVAHAQETDSTVIVSTATIALQRQLVDRDLPRLAESLEPLLDHKPSFAIMKGRQNYLCQNKRPTIPTVVTPTATQAARRPRWWMNRSSAGWAGTWPASTNGRTKPKPATGTAWNPGCPTWPGGKYRWEPKSALVPTAAPSGIPALRNWRGAKPATWMWWSPTTHCWRSTPCWTSMCCPTMMWSSLTRPTNWMTALPQWPPRKSG